MTDLTFHSILTHLRKVLAAAIGWCLGLENHAVSVHQQGK
jgi:hypothetical protein